MFFNEPLIVTEDFRHSTDEARCYSIGVTDSSQVLFTVFTIRENKIRVISSRPANRKERAYYERFKENSSI